MTTTCLHVVDGDDDCARHGFAVLGIARRTLVVTSNILAAASWTIPRWSPAILRLLFLGPLPLAGKFAARLLPNLSMAS